MGTFHPGYIFNQKPMPKKALEAMLATHRKTDLEHGWIGYMNTALHYYPTPGTHYSFEAYLHYKVNEAASKGKKLRVLEIGVGTGNQWVNFWHLHKNNLELLPTSLTPIDFPIKDIPVTVCHAGELHEHFEEGSIDVAVTNMGTHGQEIAAIEEVVHLLKPGGEALLTSVSKEMALRGEKAGFYKIVALTKNFNGVPCLHLRKTG